MVESCLINSVLTVNKEKLHETENNSATPSHTPSQVVINFNFLRNIKIFCLLYLIY